MRTRTTAGIAGTALLTGALFGCGTGGSGDDDGTSGTTDADAAAEDDASSEEPADVSGEITVLTHRTDLVDTVFVEYTERFNQTYPDVEVRFEGITDYEGEVTIRMNTEQYGDVLMIPDSVTPAELGDFFEPLGSVEELGEKYRFIEEQSYEDVVYGIATMGNASGIVYNKRIFEEAGVTDWATSPEEFIEDLRLVQDNTDAIPYYTNYGAGWPLAQMEAFRGALTADPDYTTNLAHTDAPWTDGTDHYIMDSLLYDVVANGLTEPDPTTTDWEASKELLGRGEIASMILGSWAIVQMKDAADNPDDIDFMPFPYASDGAFRSAIGPDFNIAINKHSGNKEAARAFLDFFVDESGYYADSGAISVLHSDPMPDELAAFEEAGVELIEQNPAPTEEQGLTDEIDAQSEVGLWQPDYRQRIVDAARGATDETLEEIFADLNAKWADGRAAVTG